MSCYNIKNLIYLTLLNLIINYYSNVDATSHRLHQNAYPIKYNIRIKVHPEKNIELYEARVKIQIKIQEPSDKITLHSKVLQSITNITVLDVDSKIAHNASYKFESDKDFLIVNLPYKMNKDSEIVLKFYYNSTLKRIDSNSIVKRGFMITSYKEPDGRNESMISTGFSPFYARQCFPCFDEPSFKALFRIEIEHHELYNAVSNMPVESRVNIKGNDNFVRTRFEVTPKMSTYLVAIFVSKLKAYPVKNSSVPQTVYARSSKTKNEYLKFMINNLGKILQTFENLFQMPFSLPKLDHLVVPNYYSALENWGAIGYSENYLNDKFSHKYWNISVLFHEIAHHYFGNLVTPKWWSYTWLKEGFAEFYECEVEELLFPNYKNQLDFSVYYKQNDAFETDSVEETKSLNFYEESPIKVLQKFATFTYHKGAMIIRMFKHAFGAETWEKGIRYYLQINQHNSTEPKDLHVAIQKAYDEDNPKNNLDISKVMDLWENRNGFPNISVSLVNGNLRLTQENDFHPDLIYQVPITYSTSSDPNFNNLSTKFWMTTRTIEIKIFKDDWIIFNNQQVGYYKVYYDENLWNRIIDQFLANHRVINIINRMTLINALAEAVKSEMLDATFLLRLFKYFKHEDNIDIIKTAADPLWYLFSIQTLKPTNEYNQLKSELKITYTIAYEKIKHDELYEAIHNIACHLNVKSCTTDAINKMLLDFKIHGINIDPLHSYCNALQHANDSVVEMFYDFREPIIDKHENHTFFSDITCIQNPKLFKKSLNIFFENENHKKYFKEPPYMDPEKLFAGWTMTDATREGFISFLETNLKKLASESPELFSDLLFYGRNTFENDSERKQLRKIKKNAQKINSRINDEDLI
ncbi:hypothetical protein ACKWTF_004296 [Chironomus riparius]